VSLSDIQTTLFFKSSPQQQQQQQSSSSSKTTTTTTSSKKTILSAGNLGQKPATPSPVPRRTTSHQAPTTYARMAKTNFTTITITTTPTPSPSPLNKAKLLQQAPKRNVSQNDFSHCRKFLAS